MTTSAYRRRVAAVVLSVTAAVCVPGAIYLTADNPPVPAVGGVPLFNGWQKPDAVIVLSGQTYGYLRPCGCSPQQKGGLERRANLIAALKAKGWPVVAADLGDVAPHSQDPKYPPVHDQDLLKYKTAMTALREMGYSAIGIGHYDFEKQLWDLFGEYALQHADTPPYILSANLVGKQNGQIVPREKYFLAPPAKRPMVEAIEVADAGGLAVGFTSVIGKDLMDKLRKVDPNFEFLENKVVVPQLTAELAAHPKKPAVNVLLYQGTKGDALTLAAAVPQFQIILCLSGTAESEPPQFPMTANGGKTLVIQVGHKGQNVGVVGVFKTDKGYELKYQLVPLTEDFVTPDDKVKDHKVLALLEKYAEEVKQRDLLAKFTAQLQKHTNQIQFPNENLRFVGSEACVHCHAGEMAVWRESKHSHAMEALEKIASRPKNRQFDGECVICHTVGFRQESGYTSDAKTPQLRHVGCESCHGPGSGHVAKPMQKDLLAALSPWKHGKPENKLPPKAVLEQLAATPLGAPAPVQLTPAQQATLTAVGTACIRCHDTENDPKFDVNKYMPKIWHSGLKPVAAIKPAGK